MVVGRANRTRRYNNGRSDSAQSCSSGTKRSTSCSWVCGCIGRVVLTAPLQSPLRSLSTTDTPGRPASDPAGFDLVINASLLGLNADDPLPIDVARLDADTVVVDILMKQLTTLLLRACAARGITAHAGHEMLVQQTPEYLAFFGYPEITQAVQADPSAVRALLLCP